MRLIAFRASLLSSDDIISGSRSRTIRLPGIGPFSNCFNYLNIAATEFYPKSLNPVVACIWVKITLVATLIPVWTERRVCLFFYCFSDIKNWIFLFTSLLVFPPCVGSNLSSPVPVFILTNILAHSNGWSTSQSDSLSISNSSSESMEKSS